MSEIPSARDVLEATRRYVEDPEGPKTSAQRAVRLATVDAGYTSGNPRVTFDGETVLSTREYVSVIPVAAGARVVMIPVGRTFVIVGDVEDGLLAQFESIATDLSDLDDRVDDLEAPLVQSGWAATVGNGTAEQDVAITFPEAFASGTYPVVLANMIGYKSGTGALANLGDVLHLGSNTTDARSGATSATGCTIRYSRASGTWGTGNRYVVAWIAHGIRA